MGSFTLNKWCQNGTYPIALLFQIGYICSDINKDVPVMLIFMESKRAEWESFRINIEESYRTCNRKILSTLDIHLATDDMQEAILLSCN
jgi:hypothetical protein